MLLRRLGLISVLVASAVAVAPAAAVAAPVPVAPVGPATAASGAPAGFGLAGRIGYRPEPWQPWIQPEWTAPAGRYCTFPLQVRVVSQDVRVRVVARYPDGVVKWEEFAGPLIVDFVNADNGQAVRRDAGGSGLAEYRPDGNFSRYTIVGPAGFGFRDGDGLPKGYYLLDGLHVISFDATGTRSLSVGIGERENVCHPLGDVG